MATQLTVICPFKNSLKSVGTELSFLKNTSCTNNSTAKQENNPEKPIVECSDPPDTIQAVYTDDLDILQFHNAILSRFKYFTQNVGEIINEITFLKRKLEDTKMYPNEIFVTNEEIKRLEAKVAQINSNVELNEYLSRSKSLLNEYSSFASNSLQNLIDTIRSRAKKSSQKNDTKELIGSVIAIPSRCNISIDKSTLEHPSGLRSDVQRQMFEHPSGPRSDVQRQMLEHPSGSGGIDILTEEKQSLDEISVRSSEEKEITILNNSIQDRIERRVKIIDEYLNIARKYINIEVVKLPRKPELSCTNCGFNLHDLALNTDDVVACPYCSCERIKITRIQLASEDSESNSDKNSYEDRENFYKSILRYQGRQTNVIPEEKIFRALDTYFTECRLPIGSEVKLMPANKRGRRGKTSIPLLIDALKSTKYSKYYEHVYLIANHYWGWIPNDITHLEDKLMADYDATQTVYNRIPHGERKAALNTQLRLYVQLLALGHPCQKTDFKIPKSQVSLDFFQQMWQTMCKETGVKYCFVD